MTRLGANDLFGPFTPEALQRARSLSSQVVIITWNSLSNTIEREARPARDHPKVVGRIETYDAFAARLLHIKACIQLLNTFAHADVDPRESWNCFAPRHDCGFIRCRGIPEAFQASMEESLR